jgi:hypothetical protein
MGQELPPATQLSGRPRGLRRRRQEDAYRGAHRDLPHPGECAGDLAGATPTRVAFRITLRLNAGPGIRD